MNVDLTKLSPDVQQAYHAYMLTLQMVDKLPDGAEKEKRRMTALDTFMAAQTGVAPKPMDALEHMLQTKDRRTLYPGSVHLDLSRRKEELFDEAYKNPNYSKELMEEFFQKAQSSQLDPFFVCFMGMTLGVNGKFAADDMTKRVHRLAAIMLREPPTTQAERYNFYKLAELPEEVQLSASKGIPSLPFPLFPFHPLTQAKNSDLLHRAQEVEGGGTDSKASKFRSFYSFPERTLWGSGYTVPVHGFDGQQVGIADLSDVEAQFMQLHQQVQNLSEKQTRELSKTVSRRMNFYEKRGQKKNTPQQGSYRKDQRGNGSRVYRGGAATEADDDLLEELFPPTVTASKNAGAPSRPFSGPE